MCAAQLLTRRSTVLTTHACHTVPQLTGESVWELPTETAVDVDPFAAMEAMLDDDEPADESAEAEDPFAAMEAMLAGGASSSDDEDLLVATTEDAEDDDDFRMLEAMLD